MRALESAEGVEEVQRANRGATVAYDPQRTSVEAVLKAGADTGYTVTIVKKR